MLVIAIQVFEVAVCRLSLGMQQLHFGTLLGYQGTRAGLVPGHVWFLQKGPTQCKVLICAKLVFSRIPVFAGNYLR